MGCLARDFLPSDITFSWTYKNNSKVSQSIRSFRTVLTNGKYAATSQVLLPSRDFAQGTDEHLVCQVQHGSGSKKTEVPLPGERQASPGVTETVAWPGEEMGGPGPS